MSNGWPNTLCIIIKLVAFFILVIFFSSIYLPIIVFIIFIILIFILFTLTFIFKLGMSSTHSFNLEILLRSCLSRNSMCSAFLIVLEGRFFKVFIDCSSNDCSIFTLIRSKAIILHSLLLDVLIVSYISTSSFFFSIIIKKPFLLLFITPSVE